MTNKEFANTISSELNKFGVDYKGIADELRREHPTLQQNFTRLCVAWLERCAEDGEDTFDLRNQATHEIAKKAMAAIKNEPLPFI